MKELDGRSLTGIRNALASAIADEDKDKEIRRLLDNGVNYEMLAAHLGVSRQRASLIAKRASARAVLLSEYRAEVPMRLIYSHWRKIAPRKSR